MTKTKVNGWVNHGDVNPREYGATFLRDLGDSFDIVDVVNTEDNVSEAYAKEHGRYIFKHANVSKDKIMADMSLREYADAINQDEATNLIWAATSWLGYYGGDEEPLITNNFHEGLRSMGISSYK